MADLSPEVSNAFELPIFEISILEDEKSPCALVQNLSPGGARGVFYRHGATVKKPPDDVIDIVSQSYSQFAVSGVLVMRSVMGGTGFTRSFTRRTLWWLFCNYLCNYLVYRNKSYTFVNFVMLVLLYFRFINIFT
jgi:hypothetical protein